MRFQKFEGALGKAEHELGIGEVIGKSSRSSNRVAGFVGGVSVVDEVAFVSRISPHVPFPNMGADVTEWFECFRNRDSVGVNSHVGDA